MQIFLSHSSADSDLVAQVKAAVRSLAAVYCTEDDVQAGINVHSKIQAQIRKSDLMIVLLSHNGAASPYLHQEIGFAKSAGKLIIPVVSTDVSARSLGMLEGIEYIQLDDDVDWLTRLSIRVEAVVRTSEAKAKADKATTDLVLSVVVLAAVLLAARQL